MINGSLALNRWVSLFILYSEKRLGGWTTINGQATNFTLSIMWHKCALETVQQVLVSVALV